MKWGCLACAFALANYSNGEGDHLYQCRLAGCRICWMPAQCRGGTSYVITRELRSWRMRHLAATADVFASTYRPAVNKRFGLLPDQLAAASERGIVYMSATAYGHSGPWKDRPGFDQNGQVASGFVMAEGQGGPPRFSPVFYLADLITGHFAAAGMMAALYRRAIEGGSYQVKLSLARSAMWVQDLGLLDVAAQGEVPETDSYPAETVSIDTAYGTVTSLAPALTFTSLTLPATGRLAPHGADPASWPSETS